jgi:hypothetical protein
MRHVPLCGMALLLFATGRLKDIEPKQAIVVVSLMIQDAPVLLTAIVQPPEEQ